MLETIRQAQTRAFVRLKKAKIKTAALDAVVLLGFILHKPKEYLYAYPEKKLSEKQRQRLNKIIVQRAKGIPVAYLTGQKEFYGLLFFVDKNVLIPRPKTELLVDSALALIASDCRNKTVNIADIGTGSGCIAVTLAKRTPNARLFAVDVSAAALSVAKRNAKLHGVTKKIKFYRGDLLSPLKNKKPDIIIANLPYLRRAQIKGDIRFEPRHALISGNNGLTHYKRLFEQLAALNHRPQFIILEADKDQPKQIRAMAHRLLPRNIKLQLF